MVAWGRSSYTILKQHEDGSVMETGVISQDLHHIIGINLREEPNGNPRPARTDLPHRYASLRRYLSSAMVRSTLASSTVAAYRSIPNVDEHPTADKISPEQPPVANRRDDHGTIRKKYHDGLRMTNLKPVF